MINEEQLLSTYRALPVNMQTQVFDFIHFLWHTFREKQADNQNLLSALRPIRQSISIEDIRKEQSHKKPSRAAIRKIAQEMDIQEPIMDLLSDLKA